MVMCLVFTIAWLVEDRTSKYWFHNSDVDGNTCLTMTGGMCP